MLLLCFDLNRNRKGKQKRKRNEKIYRKLFQGLFSFMVGSASAVAGDGGGDVAAANPIIMLQCVEYVLHICVKC